MATALITGASSGIGSEFAHLFAADQHGLVLVARRTDRLKALGEILRDRHNVRVDVIEMDLSREEAAQSLFDEVKKFSLEVDFLVNNAGIGDYGLFQEREWPKMNQMIMLNAVTLTHLTHLFVREMVKRKRGRILNVASIAGFQPCPTFAAYAATKAYVLSFTEALHHELRGTNVTATVLCPGPTLTGFQAAADMEGVALFKGRNVMSSSEVAASGYRAMMRGKMLVVPGFMNKAVVQGPRFLPRTLVPVVSRFVMRRVTD
jgi:hypothetical protein